MPLVSIIIPLHNEAALLSRCVDSVLDQTFSDIEVLLINDGSTDGSETVCNEYAKRDDRIKVIHQEVSGVSLARNAGLDLASGAYIQFVDADDYILPDMTDTLVKAMEREDVDMAVSNVDQETVQENGIHSITPMRTLRSGRFALADYISLFGEAYNYAPVSAIWNKLMKKNLIDKAGIRFKKNCRNGEDVHFCCQYLAECTSVYVDERRLYRYVLGYTPETLVSWNRYFPSNIWLKLGAFRSIDKLARRKTPVAMQHNIEGMLANLLAGAFVSHCRRDATLSRKEILRDLGKILSLSDVREWLTYCQALPGKSRLLPLLMRLNWTRVLFFLARHKADQRFGRFYPTSDGNVKTSTSLNSE